MPDHLHLAVALDGAGWHPAAWREPNARPRDLFSPRYWADLVRTAERGLLDLVTIDDAFGIQTHRIGVPDDRVDEVRGRLDALLIASFVAPLTSRIGLVPTVTTTHTEPFHVSKALATLDHTSLGRAGWQARVSGSAAEAALVGRRVISGYDPRILAAADLPAELRDLFDEAADVIDVVRRLWDSWEDDAEIRDVATRRFIDRSKVHHVDFEGRFFSVRGPSITPRPPQGQPVVSVLAHRREPYELAARAADLVFVTPTAARGAEALLGDVARAVADVGRDGEPLHVYADVVAALDGPGESGADRLRRLDDVAGEPYTSDTTVFGGSAAELADLVASWQALGYRGVRLRPAALPGDLDRIVTDLVPELQRRGLHRTSYPEVSSLRGLLGLPTAVPNRYAEAV
ncbi:alkanesulfonate monooxygenase SsuD/methylene tetrahydromethanopterin reductase-like flavin-dependent oxidoreductase (luciferase family) [Pseudonocardia hierapolitana]|uniref:Alkanesulfonate monooxygenase SsuD/methylene tetrahydromethanopterin reductase-like flavin-dependent oxidoreductase (Luciferase family) n=1 Tax=Pseudonocardia hierapolitana TaxID=1128676 RepID=A0A561T0R0_9PSEU|nr:LLM class flavin-dependent oxidoreductase [Pseudonocardia hierapolitana]TWF80702.1 alkanesulfonate monooxygenase SsuD/methylene tetrahydromethanopterin reductase-like flavin-dependent oxidoreductase (luciferase family) [Pseudonocardia hierapolitana]